MVLHCAATPLAQACYEVAGFFWWQGDKDSRDMVRRCLSLAFRRLFAAFSLPFI